jgi:hypothetical protein
VTHPALHPPYGLATVTFRHRALAALASRAPIGPARDVALAWFVCARLLDGTVGAQPLSDPARIARAAAARAWIASAGIPTGSRVPLTKVVDACGVQGVPDRQKIVKATTEALRATAEHLDPQARTEVEQFVKV